MPIQRRPLSEIANDVKTSWKGITPHAEEYRKLLSQANKVTDKVGGRSYSFVVERLLYHSVTWRGKKAREIKAELQLLLT